MVMLQFVAVVFPMIALLFVPADVSNCCLTLCACTLCALLDGDASGSELSLWYFPSLFAHVSA